jgi:DNA-nicking Smr family endonuclease
VFYCGLCLNFVHADKARQLLVDINDLKKKLKESRAEVDFQCARLANPDCMEWKIDLHGQSAAKATEMFVNQLECLIRMNQPGGILFKVIVGQGHHSEGNVPKIKNQVGSG